MDGGSFPDLERVTEGGRRERKGLRGIISDLTIQSIISELVTQTNHFKNGLTFLLLTEN